MKKLRTAGDNPNLNGRRALHSAKGLNTGSRMPKNLGHNLKSHAINKALNTGANRHNNGREPTQKDINNRAKARKLNTGSKAVKGGAELYRGDIYHGVKDLKGVEKGVKQDKRANAGDQQTLNKRRLGKKGLEAFKRDPHAKQVTVNIHYRHGSRLRRASSTMTRDHAKALANTPIKNDVSQYNTSGGNNHHKGRKLVEAGTAKTGGKLGLLYLISHMIKLFISMLLNLIRSIAHTIFGTAISAIAHAAAAVGGFIGSIASSIGGFATTLLGGLGVLGVSMGLVFGANQILSPKLNDDVECAVQQFTGDSSVDENIPKSKLGIAKEMWQECKKNGLSDAAAAGVCGQAHQEDPSLSPTQGNIGGAGGGKSDGGMGIFQITPGADGSYGSIQSWASKRHEDWKSPAVQVDMFLHTFFKPYLHKHGSLSQEATWASEAEGGGKERADTNEGNRQAGARMFYKKFAGSGGSSMLNDNDADANDAAGSADAASACGKNTGSTDTDDIIAYGKKFLGLGYSQGTHAQGAEDIGKGKSKSQCAKTDCSGFVWGVLKHCGYKVPSSPFTVGSGGSENRWFDSHGKCSASDTHAGSVVMADSDPHTAFLEQKWHGGSTKVLEEGGAGNDVNDTETYNYAFGSGNKPSEFANPEKK